MPCTEHASCALPVTLTAADVELVAAVGPTGGEYISVRYSGREIGTMQDDGFRAYDGCWMERWEAFAGGSMVPLGEGVTGRVRVLGALLEYCTRAAFHWRMALHH